MQHVNNYVVLYVIIKFLCMHVDHHTLAPVGQGESAGMLRGDQDLLSVYSIALT